MANTIDWRGSPANTDEMKAKTKAQPAPKQ
jgi:hypothetical protein